MKNKIHALVLMTFITSGELYACPMCAGQNPNDKYYLYVVGVFILLIYIPMFYMFKTFIKFKNINNNEEQK